MSHYIGGVTKRDSVTGTGQESAGILSQENREEVTSQHSIQSPHRQLKTHDGHITSHHGHTHHTPGIGVSRGEGGNAEGLGGFETINFGGAVNWPLLWLSILRFSETSQFAEASEGFRLLFLCRKSGSFTVELWS